MITGIENGFLENMRFKYHILKYFHVDEMMSLYQDKPSPIKLSYQIIR
jgi:hypothetical protein